jgi:hypothetical protein
MNHSNQVEPAALLASLLEEYTLQKALESPTTFLTRIDTLLSHYKKELMRSTHLMSTMATRVLQVAPYCFNPVGGKMWEVAERILCTQKIMGFLHKIETAPSYAMKDELLRDMFSYLQGDPTGLITEEQYFRDMTLTKAEEILKEPNASTTLKRLCKEFLDTYTHIFDPASYPESPSTD